MALHNSVIENNGSRPQLDEIQLQDEVTELIRSESNWISAMTGSLNASTNMEIDVKQPFVTEKIIHCLNRQIKK